MTRRPRIAVIPYGDENLEHLPVRYVKAVESIDCEPVMLRHKTPLPMLNEILDHLDGVLVSGGIDVDPELYGEPPVPETSAPNHWRDELEMYLIPLCIARDIPLLGICRGIQAINVALGGSLIQDVPTRFGVKHWRKRMPGESPYMHTVHVLPGNMLYEITGGDIPVNSYHHQCIDRLAKPLTATAYAPEGFIEAVEMTDTDRFLMAVQWHPEITREDDEYSMGLFRRFERAVRERMA